MSWIALDDAEATVGAKFADCGGVRIPSRFDSPEREGQAVRHTAGLLDARNRAILSLGGGDRLTFLQGQLTNDVSRLTDGDGCYAALLTIQGRIVSDLYVYATNDQVWLDVPTNRAEAVRTALERFIIADDAEFQSTGLDALVSVEGPQAAGVLTAVTGVAIAGLAPFQHRALTIDGVAVQCVAVSQTGETGFRLLGPRAAAAPLWQRLRGAGAVPVGFDALNVLRIEAGLPWYGVDMDEDTLVMEVGLDTAISFNKGCYLGQEIVERVAARGHVNRKLCGLSASGPSVPPANTVLRHDDKDVGHLTSATWSPALGKVVALGYVHRSACEIGTLLQAAVNGAAIDLTITPRPFYRSMT